VVAPAGEPDGTDQITSPGVPGGSGFGGVHTSAVVTEAKSGLAGGAVRSLSTIVTTPRALRTGMVDDVM
jgi:hypothetical protein